MSRAMRDEVPFGNARVGGERPVYIVFEAGPTHDGLNTALKLVDVAVTAGADAIKFQIIDVEKIIPDPTVMFSYRVLLNKNTGEEETVVESLKTILKRREMPLDDWRVVIEYCKKVGIEFFSTATNFEEIEFLASMNVGSVKICSGDIDCHYLLRKVAQCPWTVQIDTGNATIGEVEQAIDVLEQAGCSNIIINHCPSGYPARLDGINLKIIQTLKQMFPYPIAFSDHTSGETMDIAAVALGADMLEKTITLDRTCRSPEHIMSLEPDDAVSFVTNIRTVEQALGNSRRIISHQERKNLSAARRSIVASHDLKRGTVICSTDLNYIRPGTGLSPAYEHLIIGKMTSRDILEGTEICISDIS